MWYRPVGTIPTSWLINASNFPDQKYSLISVGGVPLTAPAGDPGEPGGAGVQEVDSGSDAL